MSNSKSPQIAAAAALIMAAGNGGDAQAAHLLEQMSLRLQNKMEKYAAQKQKDDSAISFKEETTKTEPEAIDSIPAQKTSSYTSTQDSASIEDTYNNGKTKNSATIDVSRTINDADSNTSIISTHVHTDEKELNRRGKTTSSTINSTNTIERINSFGGNHKQETNFSHAYEYDRQGRLRTEETTRSKDSIKEAGALDISHGYNAEHRYGTSQSRTIKLDTKDQVSTIENHYERYGETAKVADGQTTARRGTNLEELTDDMKGIKNDIEAKAAKNRYNQGSADVNIRKYDKEGKIKKSFWSKITENTKEVYKKFKQGKNKEKTIDIISKNDEISGTKTVIKNDGSVKRNTLSDRAAIRHLKKLRNGINENLEQLTGAKNMEEYIDRVPDVDQEKRAPLGLVFEKHDQDKLKDARDNMDIENGKKLDQQKQISATDIMNHIVQAKLQKGE